MIKNRFYRHRHRTACFSDVCRGRHRVADRRIALRSSSYCPNCATAGAARRYRFYGQLLPHIQYRFGISMEGITGSELSSLQNILILKKVLKSKANNNGSVSFAHSAHQRSPPSRNSRQNTALNRPVMLPLTRAKLNALYGCGKTSSTTTRALCLADIRSCPLTCYFFCRTIKYSAGCRAFY